MKVAFTYNIQKNDIPEEAEFDTPETIELVNKELQGLGHTVKLIDVKKDVTEIIRDLKEFSPDIIFNTAEGQNGRFREAFCPALFDNLEIPFAGSDAYTCTVTLDKSVTKLMLHKNGIRTPNWIFVQKMKDIEKFPLRFPVIIKPNFEGSSRGISLKNIHENLTEMKDHLEKFLQQFPEGIIIEEFVDGVDLTVPYLQAAFPETHGVLPACLYTFEQHEQGNYKIYDFKLKQYLSSQVIVNIAEDLSPEIIKEIQKTSLKTYEILNVKDIGRIDYRLSKDGKLYFIEINALPCLQEGASIYISASSYGLSVKDVIQKILESAQKRYGI
ncbi:hypothetical protein A2X44_04800 [candidate division CPR3 bacterium GWF2_35_18]|uniref:D-alanine-D-alanine ligase n=1 Tax=candidate division CPR3 bacterium GW2011_GWF2_35_18 TaxID=1618350 RepID=A0A0G0BK05_UNCC3|nr:MAG: D-alanine-D-alanine ligase [candidate division CPR3 bacterium GW2011_GWF2_35_18]KKP86684.1 MAG: D-alanine-D-alanine ligase [candidate division CPR3 bacterium GW2011_GWE2_35_7]OGB63652.1 MAG: hypothetical protein A2X44_04800 [candidate division CPR3 bacterium GWF2_35_18]OGB65027.1 MAG: hypothetical protein A2250_01240 [candidate division CPR3 bacterium RIFOXYA2_FULL_35_13]OGB80446.1 MAG: hypothetical protein A2011_03775 [candidate division CPR3 bacterium GWE2_35_7]